MERGVNLVVIDNCNLEAWEAQPYVALAKKQGYVAELREPATEWRNDAATLVARTRHQVPLETIEQQLRRATNYTIRDCSGKARVEPKRTLTSSEIDSLRRAAADAIDTQLREKKARLSPPPPPSPAAVAASSATTATATTAVAPTTNSATSSTSSSAPPPQRDSVRFEIAVNDGRKSKRRPCVLRDDDFDRFLSSACKALQVVVSRVVESVHLCARPQVPRSGALVYDADGNRITRVADIVPDSLLLIGAHNAVFVATDVKRTDASSTTSTTTTTTTFLESTTIRMSGNALGRLPLGASEAIPDLLFVGSGRDAHSADELARIGVVCVLNVARDIAATRVASVAAYLELPLDDVERQSLLQVVPRALAFIDLARQQRRRVLVHCAVGRSRSVAIVIAYLVVRERRSLAVRLRCLLSRLR